MKNIKTYEEFTNKDNYPIYLSNGDFLYISDYLASLNINNAFWSKGIGLNSTNLHVTYNGMYRMDIKYYVYHKDKTSLSYCVYGSSGDSEMHNKNMIKATRECNYKVICEFFPEFKNVKNGYKLLKNGSNIFDLIPQCKQKYFADEKEFFDKNIKSFKEFVSQNKINKNIIKIECFRQCLTNLDGVEDLEQLEKLNCSSNYLTSIKGIENLTNLIELDCRNNPDLNWDDYIDKQGRIYYIKLPKSITTLKSDKFSTISNYWKFYDQNQPVAVSRKFNF